MNTKFVRVLGAMLLTVFVFSFLVAGVPTSDLFGSLETMQAALPDYYYYFDGELEVEDSFCALTNKSRSGCASNKNYDYIGYYLFFKTPGPIIKQITIYAEYGGDLNFMHPEMYQDIEIDGVSCKFLKYEGVSVGLLFILENVRYYIKCRLLYTDKTAEEFLSICETAILSRYKV